VSARIRLLAAAALVILVVGAIGLAYASGGGSEGGKPSVGKLQITGQYVTSSENQVSSVYFTVKNHGAEDTLLTVSTNASDTASIHQDVTKGNSSSMQLLQDLTIPANGELVMKPGAYHVMITNLSQPLKTGTSVSVTLRFAKAGSVTFDAPVRSIIDTANQ
jgi:periplasmic copper chaperone A